MSKPHILRPFGRKTLKASWHVTFDKGQLTTPTGPLMLRQLRAWVYEDERESSTHIFSHFVMRRLGYSVDELLSSAREHQEEFDLNELETSQEMSGVSRNCRVISRITWQDRWVGEEDEDMQTATPELATPTHNDIRKSLKIRIVEAEHEGLNEIHLERLTKLLDKHSDMFRLPLGRDPPVRVASLRVRVREGTSPVKCWSRRYPPEYMKILERHIDDLLNAGLAYVTTEAAMRHLLELFRCTYKSGKWHHRKSYVADASPGSLDWAAGWITNLPLYLDSQERFTIITHRGMVTPTRVRMGGTDTVGYCQNVVEDIFQPLLYHGLLAWLGDILGYAKTVDGRFDTLEKCSRLVLNLA
ncbi:hypothetical protein PHPALM_28569 [Phytophthora palmivora]|uniref:Reverse transcriptase n=1 Tax=Phytophthora palmivora TaxID=4796 RepID=A0A2P4X9R4_9STRA|nr:hypothetical protein PHPALM_28569 [Phytophthora palmivora]